MLLIIKPNNVKLKSKLLALCLGILLGMQAALAGLNLPQKPLFVASTNEPPLVLLVMGRNHKLFYEAYNDASDLNDDGNPDVGYKPNEIDYFGYFDSFKCYHYDNTNKVFIPKELAGSDKTCPNSSAEWSGDFLNYLTMARMDAIRKVLYGGYRSTDTATETYLERTHVPQDAHSWGKEYTSQTVDGYKIEDYTPLAQPTSGRHLFANTSLQNTSNYDVTTYEPPLLRVLQNSDFRIWEWVSKEQPVAGSKCKDNSTCGNIVDYEVRVQVCVPGANNDLLEDNCELYSNGTSTKPTGLLHDFGASDEMKFGLLTGSYEKRTAGGVMRKLMGTFTDEFDPDDGTFTSTVGIVKTIDRLREINFGFINHNGDAKSHQHKNKHWWGNPIAEMMYEGLRYFAGNGSPLNSYSIATSGNDDADLGLPLPSWDNPYDTTTGGAENCAIPIQLVISDINPSYDSDALPGSNYSNRAARGIYPNARLLNVKDIADSIGTAEGIAGGTYFIGQSENTYDALPSAKTITNLGSIRGLAPEEPTKQGSYYAASIAAYGIQTDISPTADDDQNVRTFAVALASPLPKFEIPVRDSMITLVPFAKSVGDESNQTLSSPALTNSIVDFYIEEMYNTDTSNQDANVNGGLPQYIFRINYEDREEGGDHDMDAIVQYTLAVDGNNTTDTSDDELTVTLNSTYSSGWRIQHIGFVITGTTSDGTYLVIRDYDTTDINDVDYDGDTPNDPVDRTTGTGALPLTYTGSFTPSTTATTATLLKDPLWYAAKWGGFIDEPTGTVGSNYRPIPDKTSEWDADNDGTPDSYFLVTNAGALQTQLEKAFEKIIALANLSGGAAAINSTVLRSNSRTYQATFDSENWQGQLTAYTLDTNGIPSSTAWQATIPQHDQRKIYTLFQNSSGTVTAIEFDEPGTNEQLQLKNKIKNAAQGNVATAIQAGTINGNKLIRYLRGEGAHEQKNRGPLRDRTVPLGDIVHSSPISVSDDDFHYDALTCGGDSYKTYLAAKHSRYSDSANNTFSMIYVAANDGMLHAFQDTGTTGFGTAGKELFAYVPKATHDKLALLADPDYSHKFFVDGTPSAHDACINLNNAGDEWVTLLSGTLGLGGRAIYTLNVSDPQNFTADDVLWEVDDNNSDSKIADAIGHILHAPTTVRLENGEWGVVVGNGYNSDSHTAQLLIFNAENGNLIKAFDTGVGSSTNPNGMAQPFVLDTNADRIADFVYAGDLHGNLWKFDLTDKSANNWGIPYPVTTTYPEGQPLYTAQDAVGNTQAITTRPVVVNNTSAGATGHVILFGTGKFIETGDASITDTQTFYGIHDDGITTLVTADRNNLVQQTMTEYEFSNSNTTARVVSDHTVTYSTSVRGWYLDFPQKERIIANPITRYERIIFTTYAPEGTCQGGGDSVLMELDAVNGARLQNSVFDFNGDGVIDGNDFAQDSSGNSIAGSGIYIPGTMASPSVIVDPNKEATEYKLTSGNNGTVTSTQEAAQENTYGRKSWRQLN